MEFYRNNAEIESRKTQAHALKKELDEGLEKWSRQVLDVQKSNIRRAEDLVDKEKNKKCEKLKQKRLSRERKVKDRKVTIKEQELRELEFRKEKIEMKNKKV